MPLSDEDAAALIAELERARRKTEAMQAKLEKKKRELARSKWEKELHKREYEAWFQSGNVEMPMFPLLEGPQQSAPTAVALAAEDPAAEVMNGTRVFPYTVASNDSVARAARELGSVAGNSSEIWRERGASNHPFDPGTVLPLSVRYHNSSWPKHGSNSNSNSSSNGSDSNSSNGSKSSSSNDTTGNYDPWWGTTCAVKLLRPFDPGKGCRRDARRGKAVIGVDFPFDRGKALLRIQHGG